MAHDLHASDLTTTVSSIGAGNIARRIQFGLYATVTIFYAANLYSHAVTAYLWVVKFVLLGILFLFCLIKLERGTPRRPNFGLLLFIFMPMLIGVVVSDDAWRSMEYCVSVIIVVITGQIIATLPSNGRQLQSLFDVFGNIGRVVIVTSAIMWLLSLNLGRGFRFSGWTDNPNTLGLMLAPTLTIMVAGVLQQRNPWLLTTNGIFFAVGMFILLKTGSRAAFLWVVVASFALIFGRRMSLLHLTVALCAMVLLFIFFNDIKLAAFDLLSLRTSGSGPCA